VGKDFASSYVMLDVAQDPFMAVVHRSGLIIALEEFFGRVQIFGNELTLAKCCQKSGPASAQIKRSLRWFVIADLTKALYGMAALRDFAG